MSPPPNRGALRVTLTARLAQDLPDKLRALLQARLILLKLPEARSAEEVDHLANLLINKVDIGYFKSLPTELTKVRSRSRKLLPTRCPHPIPPPLARQLLCRGMSVHMVPSGEVLFRQGDVGHHFFVSLAGTVSIWIKPANDQKVSGRG